MLGRAPPDRSGRYGPAALAGASAIASSVLVALLRRDRRRRGAERMARFAASLSAASTHLQVVRAAAAVAEDLHGTCFTTLWLVDRQDPTRWRQWHHGRGTKRDTMVLHPADGRFPFERAAATGQPVITPDLATVAREFPRALEIVTRSGARAGVTLPVFDEHGDAVGAMGFGWSDAHAPGPDQLARLATITQLSAETSRRIDLAAAADAEADARVKRARNRQQLAELLTASSTREELLGAIAGAAPLLGVDAVRAWVASGPSDRTRAALLPDDDGAPADGGGPVSRATVPLREAASDPEVMVELDWRTPCPRAEVDETIATLLAVGRPAWSRTELVEQLEQRRRTSDLRAAFGTALASAVTEQRTADVIAAFARDLFAADGAVVLHLDDGSDAPIVAAAAGISGPTTVGRTDGTAQASSPVLDAITGHEIVVVESRRAFATRYPHCAPHLGDEVEAVAVLPLVAGDRAVGAIGLHYRLPNPRTDLLEEDGVRFVTHAAQAFERSRLADRQRGALEQATRLRDAVAALASASNEVDVEAAVLARGLRALGAAGGALVLSDDDVAGLVRPPHDPQSGEEPAKPAEVDRSSPLGAALATRAPVYVRHETGAEAGIPLVAGTQCVGALAIAWESRLAFTGAERYAIESYAEYVAQALRRARDAAREHEIVAALQERLLPRLAPEVTGARVATRYRPAARGLDIGGDWYDVICLSPMRTAFVVGDVVGKGPAAAASMGQVRTAVRTKSLDAAPDAVLAALDHNAAQHLEPDFMATVSYCVFDALDRSISYASAGHCPGLVVDEHGDARWLGGNGPPIGALWDRERSLVQIRLDGLTRFVLFTDGLVERRGESLDAGFARLADIVARTRELDVERCADVILADLVPGPARPDDIALVVADLDPAPPPLDIELPAEPASVGRMRSALRTWLAESFVDEERANDVVIATNEAVANAVEHGSTAEGTVRVRAARAEQSVQIEVSDRGTATAREPDPDRGRGLEIMRAVMDDVRISPSLVGTTVRMERLVD